MITLTSQDKETFQIDAEIAKRSMLLKNLLDDVGDAEGFDCELPQTDPPTQRFQQNTAISLTILRASQK